MPRQSSTAKTPSFIVEIPLVVSDEDAGVLSSRFEAGRQLYNACLGEAMRRQKLIKQSKKYQSARKLKKGKARTAAFKEANQAYGYSEYNLHSYCTIVRNSWMGEQIDSNTAQKIATRAFNASCRVAFCQAKKVRFKGKNQLDSLEGKTNKTGIRWVNKTLVWGNLQLKPYLTTYDSVISYGLSCRVKYVRLVRRRINSKTFYYAQLVCEGKPFQKPKNQIGQGTVGLDIGPSTIALVGDESAKLTLFASELKFAEKEIRRLQRKLERSRRANNPNNYNSNFVNQKVQQKKGTIKKGCKQWNNSRIYQKTRTVKSNLSRRLAAHRKSLHGHLVNDILSLGNTIKLEKLSYKSFQKNYGKSVGKRAPGGFVSHLKRKAESAGVSVMEFSTHSTKLSQTCQCGTVKKKNLSERIHQCDCGILCQRDLYSAFLAKFVDENELLQANQAQNAWLGSEPILYAAWRQATQTNLQLGGRVPSSFGKFPESERVAAKVQNVEAKVLDVVPNIWESQEEVSLRFEPPSL
ncbi:zinc ribbon domain-containing protein [Argonema antarcticum]|uniref:zinc ribbon domain-containing protein n=1 Tax=Argonema antarcticum TaxID=2942763 RepID=UPI0020110AF9|nr:zinc ribbon domain-containing protein [Argonema antarcticum]MCL1470692.1 transposase [Argonema antarcticum A004/B2]